MPGTSQQIILQRPAALQTAKRVSGDLAAKAARIHFLTYFYPKRCFLGMALASQQRR